MKIPKPEKLQPKDYGEESANGSGIQAEQTEDEKIRELWSKCPANSDWDQVENADDVQDMCFSWFEAGAKSRRQEMKELNETVKKHERWNKEREIENRSYSKHALNSQSELSEKDKQIESMKCCGNCDNLRLIGIGIMTECDHEEVCKYQYSWNRLDHWKQKK